VTPWLKRAEQVGFFDSGTNFNPLKLWTDQQPAAASAKPAPRGSKPSKDLSRNEKLILGFAA
jgi:hypothetical protein